MENETTNTVRALKAHLAINVRDVEASTDFYRRMLGLEPSKVRAGYAKFDVENPPLNLTLNQVPFNERGALSHLGVQLASTDDVLRTRERWAAAGLLTRDEMQTNCCYAVQDKTWVRDPDGNEWEAFVVLEDNLAETGVCCTTVESTPATESVSASSTTTANDSVEGSCCPPTCCETPAANVAISR
jgi:catechol 2,3-dioxygenase-like lactoylglutathione lyase family enzyme